MTELSASSEAAGAAPEPEVNSKSDFWLRYSTLIVLIVMFLGFSIFVDRFLTAFNLANLSLIHI